MNNEELILTKVKHTFHEKNVLFEVSSLKSKFDGVLIHDTDLIDVDGKEYINARNVDFSNAKPVKEVKKEKVEKGKKKN